MLLEQLGNHDLFFSFGINVVGLERIRTTADSSDP